MGEPGRSLPIPVALTISDPGGAASTRSSQGPSPTCPATRPPAVRARCPTEARIGSAQTNRAGTRVVKRCWARALAVPPAPRQTTSPSDSGQIWSATRPTETGSRAQPRSPSGVRLMALTSSQARASGSSPAKRIRPARKSPTLWVVMTAPAALSSVRRSRRNRT